MSSASISVLSADEDNHSLTVRPEDVLLACVAYTRPEVLAFDKIISLRSQNKLALRTSSESKSIADLPVELLLRIRSHLQSEVLATLEAEAAVALEEYQSALVEGICPDCFWWHSDIYGSDVWAWIENGYRGACSCAVVGDIDPRTPSDAKQRVLKTYQGIDIGTRGQWLRAFIQRTYLDDSTTAWRFARGVLSEFGCTHRFERASSLCAPVPTEPESTAAVALAPVAESTTTLAEQPESKKAPRRTTTCDFGALVRISQSLDRSEIEEPAITLGRLLRELRLKAPADDEPSIALHSSATRFVDKIHRRTACARHFLAQRGPVGNCMDCFALFAAPAASSLSYAPRCFSSSSRSSSSCFSSLFPLSATDVVSSRRTFTSLALGAASVAYLVARVIF